MRASQCPPVEGRLSREAPEGHAEPSCVGLDPQHEVLLEAAAAAVAVRAADQTDRQTYIRTKKRQGKEGGRREREKGGSGEKKEGEAL